MPLDKYRQKRDPQRTPEPFGSSAQAPVSRGAAMFVVQKHAARALHYDFRLEMEGVLRSWAVPRGPSLNPADKRLAVMVEDHPIEYGDFEGRIPTGNYGAGSVIVWDRGTYRVIDPPNGDAAAGVRAGKLDFEMHGFKLRGAFTLVRTRAQPRRSSGESKEQWLLIKKRDAFAADTDVLAEHPRSVLSGLTVEEMAAAAGADQRWRAALADLQAPVFKGKWEVSAFPLNLAKTADEPFDGKEWLFELKYDGVRALALRDHGEVRLYGRNQRAITRRYPEIVLALAALPYEQFAIDGEIVALADDGRPSFQLLQRRMHQDDPREAQRLSLATPATFFTFDLLAFDGCDLRPLGLEQRKGVLAHLIRGEGPVRYCDHVLERGKEFFRLAAEARLEGIMAKRRDSAYRGVRTGDWLKIKCPQLGRFVIGGWTDPGGARTHFGALLVGLYEASGTLRFVARVGTGFDEKNLREIHRMLEARVLSTSPFRRAKAGEIAPPARVSHFCRPELVCEVRFGERTADGGIRHPAFVRLIADADPHECRDETAADTTMVAAPADRDSRDEENEQMDPARRFKITNPTKVFWPDEGYTKGELIDYYTTMAPWMLPYLKDRPVVLTRYPDGIGGKSFYQKDAPAFAPSWIRTAKIWSEDSHREIAYFILESAEAIAYMANLGAIPIHMWSSRINHLERPDWLLFDIDPKGSTTKQAVIVARETGAVLREIGLRPYVKTSGQMGLHVVVGLVPQYTYDEARMFAELVARVVERRIPEHATLIRHKERRAGKVYIDWMQLAQGQTIAAPFAARPVPGAPVSAPLKWDELTDDLEPKRWNIKSMPPRMKRLRHDPFFGVLTDLQRIDDKLRQIELLTSDRPSDAGPS
ncbi:MAG TPA: DNA ligase D [Candidatus Binataceae bacterium]|nr:DNA ligase D [Candidatus Binataceae bacterium]